MVLPTGATSFEEAMRIVTECYHSLKSVITEKFGLAGEIMCNALLPNRAEWPRRNWYR